MLRFSAHLGYLFTELPLVDRFAAARRVGFAAVDCPAPYSIPASQMRSVLDGEGLEFVQLALPPGNAEKGEKGLGALPGREQEFLATLATALEYATVSGARFIQVQSGVVPPGEDLGRLWDLFIKNLAVAAQQAAHCGLKVLIEPISEAAVPNYFMNRSQLALRAIEEVAEPNVRILYDVFHATNAGENLGEFIAGQIDKIGHFHIADHPGRHQPGTGNLNFSSLFATIQDAGFKGLIGCEYKPSGRTEDSFDWYKPFAVRGNAFAAPG